MITNDAGCTRTRKVTSMIAMAKAEFKGKKCFFFCTSRLDLNFREKTSKLIHLMHRFVWCRNLGPSESRSEIPGKLRNVVLENDAEGQLDLSCEK
jgi:hypothetical protein